MEFTRIKYTILILLWAFYFVVIQNVFIPKTYKEEVVVKTPIPRSKAITYIKDYDPKRDYYILETYLVEKHRSKIPFMVSKVDTLSYKRELIGKINLQ